MLDRRHGSFAKFQELLAEPELGQKGQLPRQPSEHICIDLVGHKQS